jgi:radical SAM superfamily enzyme YgiQ (UPF0313 family)
MNKNSLTYILTEDKTTFVEPKILPNQFNDVVKVGLVQINNSFSGQSYLPYSIACLEGYVRDKAVNPNRFHFIDHIYKREPISKIVAHLSNADIVGFSTYVWNARISLEIARRLKKINPTIVIIFGGPQVPDHPEIFLRNNLFIDIVAHNEGELTFLNILQSYPECNWDGLTGISYVKSDGEFHKAPPTPRFKELEEVPSPFMNGIFDKLILQNQQEKWIGLWETNRGCPFQCTFCDWGSATAAKVTKFGMDRLNQELSWFAKNKIEYIFVCDANFGIQKRDVEISEAVAKIRSETGYPHGFSVQNTKNATERAYLTQKILSDAGLNKGVALSMQSLDTETLKNIKRDNISLDTYLELAKRFTKDKVETYSDLILGLPGETYESFVNGIDLLIKSGQHNRIQFNNLSVLPNAEMGNPDYIKRYGMEIIESKIINIHGSNIEIEDDVQEMQDLVVSTNSMPPEDWKKTRAFCWMTAFLYFDKILQIPILISHEMSTISYRSIIEGFMNPDEVRYPTLSHIYKFFIKEAESIQGGGEEYVYSKEWLGIYWPADEYMFIYLTVEKKWDQFYKEASILLRDIYVSADLDIDLHMLSEAISLNHALISQPFIEEDIEFKTSYNFIEYYEGVKNGYEMSLKKGDFSTKIFRSKALYKSLEQWCREVVWWGNKKGAYLYQNDPSKVLPMLDGHY